MAATLVALLAALIVWAVTSGGDKKTTDDSRPGGSDPVHEITPGPTPSGPAISQQPGGRDESDDTGGGDGGGSGTGTGGGAGGGGTDTGSGSGTGAGGAGDGAETTGRQVPPNSPLPNCAASALKLSLSTELSYGPGQKPKFRLVARNTSSTDCKADFGPKSAVLTITEVGGDDSQVWSSKDCPRNAGSLLLKVPAGATVVHTVEWDRRKSVPQCATPPSGTAGPGTYLVEAKAPGEPVQRASFVLAKD